MSKKSCELELARVMSSALDQKRRCYGSKRNGHNSYVSTRPQHPAQYKLMKVVSVGVIDMQACYKNTEKLIKARKRNVCHIHDGSMWCR